MKKFSTQRAKQLQKEEEERTREQKAKAFAKLEELNRRKLIGNQTQKLDCGAVQLKQEEHLGGSLSQSDNGIGAEASGLSGFNPDTAIQACEDVVKIKESTESSLNRPSEDSLNYAPKSSAGAMDQSVHLTSDTSSTEFVAEKSISQFPEKMAASGITTVQDNVDSCANKPSAESCVHRTDESSSVTTSPSLEPTEMSSAKSLTETKKVTPETVSAASSGKVETSRAALKASDPQHEGMVSAGHELSQPAEEAHGRTTGHWKTQSHRRVSRNTQSIRPVEKFHGNEGTIWAPVRTPINKSEPFEESSQHVNMNSGLSLQPSLLGTLNWQVRNNLLNFSRSCGSSFRPSSAMPCWCWLQVICTHSG